MLFCLFIFFNSSFLQSSKLFNCKFGGKASAGKGIRTPDLSHTKPKLYKGATAGRWLTGLSKVGIVLPRAPHKLCRETFSFWPWEVLSFASTAPCLSSPNCGKQTKGAPTTSPRHVVFSRADKRFCKKKKDKRFWKRKILRDWSFYSQTVFFRTFLYRIVLL